MRVYLMRHGIAADGYAVDEHRPLTLEGRRKAREIAALWASSGEPRPERWIVSPLVRAVQTCEIVVDAFGVEGPVEVSGDLTPDSRVSVAAELVDGHFGEVLALVGHQPLIGSLAAFLLGLRSVPAAVQPGAVLAIDLPEEEGEEPALAWHLIPGMGDEAPRLLRPPG